MKFCERLRELRKQSSISQKNIAQQLGIHVVTLQQYERGVREPNIETLLKMAILFNVSLDDLLCLDDFKYSHEVSSDES
ncbi:MAG: helix-turn-helix transcriptional regulator [Lachnospiraceae bacterium]|jgi:transcriptional regulator with XRE-family HTH domain|nr:helix-turn-helix transcriptional regulator [Lachnospiraceae bacterium]